MLQTKVSRLKELEMFLEDEASEIVFASLILASFSFVKEPIGWKGIAEPLLRWRTAREFSLVHFTARYPVGRFRRLAPTVLATDSWRESMLLDLSILLFDFFLCCSPKSSDS